MMDGDIDRSQQRQGLEHQNNNDDGARSVASAASLEQFKSNCSLYVNYLSQPGVDLSSTLESFVTWIQWLNTGNGSPGHVEYFFGVAIPQITIAVLKKTYTSETQLSAVHVFLVEIIEALSHRLGSSDLSTLKLTDGEWEMMRLLFDPSTSFYQSYGISLAAKVAAVVESDKNLEQWLEDFDSGQYAQVLQDDVWVWCRAVQVSPTNTEIEVDILNVCDGQRPKNENTSVLSRVWFPKDERLFRPHDNPEEDSETVRLCKLEEEKRLEELRVEGEILVEELDEPWRQSLEPGDMLDCRDSFGDWYGSVVVSMEKKSKDKRQDLLRINFCGFPASQDAYVHRGSKFRLAPLHYRCNGRMGHKTVSKSMDMLYYNAMVDDANDLENVYAVSRVLPGTQQTTSRYLVENLNLFGKNGCFRYLLNYITQTRSIHVMHQSILLFSCMSVMFSKSFAMAFIPKFLPIVNECVKQCDDTQVRLLNHAMSYGIVSGMERISYRVRTYFAGKAISEKLALLLNEKLIKCKAIKQRLGGLDSIIEWIDLARTHEQYPNCLRLEQIFSSSITAPVDNSSTKKPSDVLGGGFDLVASAVASKFAAISMGNGHKNTVKYDIPEEKKSTESVGEEKKSAMVEDYRYVRVSCSRSLTPVRLSNWITEMGVIESCFHGPFAHHEMVRRSLRLLDLLLKCGKFGDELLKQTIWQSLQTSYGSDEEMVNEIYKLLCDLVPSMSRGLVTTLLDLVSKIELKDYRERTLLLLRDISNSSFMRNKDGEAASSDGNSTSPSVVALNLLWSAIQQSNDQIDLDPKLLKVADGCLDQVIKHHASLDMMRSFPANNKEKGKEEENTQKETNVGLSEDQISMMIGVLSLAQKHVDNMQSVPDGKLLREVLIDYCLENVSSSNSVLQTLGVFRNVIKSFPTKKELSKEGEEEFGDMLVGKESREQVLAWLNARHSLLERLLQELITSCRTQKDDEIFHRMEFLLFCLKESDLVLEISHVDMLWDHLIANEESTEIETNACFRFFQHAAASSDHTEFLALGSATLKYVFQERLCKKEFWPKGKGLPLSGFLCFQTLFVKVNVSLGNMVLMNGQYSCNKEDGGDVTMDCGDLSRGPSLQLYEIMKLPPLAGEDILWFLALEEEDSSTIKVPELAALMLSELQLRLSSSLSSEIGRHRRSFIDVCMQKMEFATLSTKSFSLMCHKIRRLLSLLMPLLSHTKVEASHVCGLLKDRAWARLQPNKALIKDEVYTIWVSNKYKGTKHHGERFQVSVCANDPYWLFRNRVATEMGLILEGCEVDGDTEEESGGRGREGCLRVFAGGKEIKPESRVDILKGLHVFASGITVLACEKPKSSSVSSKASLVQSEQDALVMLEALPAVILSSEAKYFNKLFMVLELCTQSSTDKKEAAVGDKVASLVWNLLQELPTDACIEKSVGAISTDFVSSLTSGKVEMKLVYLVEIIDFYLSPSHCCDGSDRSLWLELFIQGHGFDMLKECLVRIVRELSSTEQSPFRSAKLRKGLSVLCKLLFHGVAADFVLQTGTFDFVHSVLPNMSQLYKVRKEIGISGATAIENTSGGSVFQYPDNDLLLFDKFISDIGTLLKENSNTSSRQSLCYQEVSSLSFLKTILGDRDDSKYSLALIAWGLGLWSIAALSSVDVESVQYLCSEAGLYCSCGSIQFLIRKLVQNLLYAISKQQESCKRMVVEGLIQVKPPLTSSSERHSEYFAVLSQVLSLEMNQDGLCLRLVELLEKVEGDESLENVLDVVPVKVDPILIGRLQLVTLLLEKLGELKESATLGTHLLGRLLEFVLKGCLFGATIKCHRSTTRAVALSLLITVLKQDGINNQHWAAVSLALQDSIEIPPQRIQSCLSKRYDTYQANSGGRALPATMDYTWSVEVGTDERAPSGFVGLVNLGFICYMNSLIQQLYMIRRVRYGVLTGDLPSEITDDDSDAKNKLRLVCELQKMFAALDLSYKQAYNPKGFCLNFLDEQKQPVNIWQQQDAHEFFNSLCDRLDETLKQTKSGKLLTNVLGVSIANQLICLEDEDLKRENEPVTEYCLSQEITFKKSASEGSSCPNLYDSLKNFVSGEVLNDYRWEERDGAKLRTLKRQCISGLSDVVFIHLKRFRLNWQTFATEKINSRFEFPVELDLFPYTKEGLDGSRRREKAYYEYQLAGVVVHAGASLNSGHYYSFIRARSGPCKDEWFEFNDRVVSPFDINKLEEATFGGGSAYNDQSGGKTCSFSHLPQVNNAYMLVYERINPLQKDEEFILVHEKEKQSLIPKAMYREMRGENATFQAIQYIYHPSFGDFMIRSLDVLISAGKEIEPSYLLNVVRYFVHTLSRSSSNVAQFTLMSAKLCQIIDLVGDEFAHSCLRHLFLSKLHDKEKGWEVEIVFHHLLLYSTNQAIRIGFVNVLVSLFKHNLDACVSVEDLAALLLLPLRNGQLDLFAWHRKAEYWEVMRGIVQYSFTVTRVFNQSYVVVRLVDMFLGVDSPLGEVWREEWLGKRVGFTSALPNPCSLIDRNARLDGIWSNAFKLLELLVTNIYPLKPEGVEERDDEPPTIRKSTSTYLIDKMTLKALSIRKFYAEVLALGNRSLESGKEDSRLVFQSLGVILVHLSYNWKDFSVHTIEVVLEGLDCVSSLCGIGFLFGIVQKLLELNDRFQFVRHELVERGTLQRSRDRANSNASAGSSNSAPLPSAPAQVTATSGRCLFSILQRRGSTDLPFAVEFCCCFLKLFLNCANFSSYFVADNANIERWTSLWSPYIEQLLAQVEAFILVTNSNDEKKGEDEEEEVAPLSSALEVEGAKLKLLLSEVSTLLEPYTGCLVPPPPPPPPSNNSHYMQRD